MINRIKKKIKNHIRTNKAFGKKVVHVEMAHITQDKLTKHLEKHSSKCYCLGPSNYDYVNSHLGVTLSKEEYHENIKEYYLKLKAMGIDLQPHVHLSRFPENLSNNAKEKLIMDTYNFFINDLEIKPTEIVFGWYASDDFSRELANKLGMKVIGEHLHIYDYWL